MPGGRGVESNTGRQEAIPYPIHPGAEPAPGPSGSASPTPTSSTSSSPTPTPSESCTSTGGGGAAETTRYYFHSASGIGNVDAIDDTTTFDTVAPTSTRAEFFDNSLFRNSFENDFMDPYWLGTVDQQIDKLE